jgi:hypothetical protein
VRWPTPYALEEFFSGQIFRKFNVRQRPKSLTRAVHTLAVDGLWRNFDVGKAFETAYRSTSDVRS